MNIFGTSIWKKKEDGRWTLPLSKSKRGDLCRTKFCKGQIRKDMTLTSNPRCSKCINRIHRANNLIRYAFHHVKDSAKKRNIPFLLSLEEFERIIDGTGYIEKKGKTRHCLQLDRIDPEKGYEIGNLQVITAGENCAKDNNRWREKKEEKPLEEIPDENCPF